MMTLLEPPLQHYRKTPLIIALLMVAAAIMAVVLTPHNRMADQRPPLTLATAIPASFGNWRIDTSMVPVGNSPDLQARLDEIYSQTLARTYANTKGERIMLSIAYGADQSGEGNQVHRPEFC